MVINYGPKGNSSSSGIDFNLGSFNPVKSMKIKFDGDSDFSEIISQGISNKYNIYFSEDKKLWALLIYANCYIQLDRTFSRAVIGAVGGGGGGGCGGGIEKYIFGANTEAGGGGGAGGEIVINNNAQLNKEIIYDIKVGTGGQKSTTEQTTYWSEVGNSWDWVASELVNGTPGGDTSIISTQNINDIIILAHGGEGGKTAEATGNYDPDQSQGNTSAYDHDNGGLGGQSYILGGTGGGHESNASDGNPEQELFDLSSVNIGKIKVSGGGGGGAGYTHWTGEDWEDPGIYYNRSGENGGTGYGSGGHGGDRGSANVMDGKNGLLIIKNY